MCIPPLDLLMMSAPRLMQKLAIVTVSLVFLEGCAGPSANNNLAPTPTPPQQLDLSPVTAQIAAGSSYKFSVTVVPANAVNTVNWSVSGAGCSGAACGSVDITGRYCAPPSPPSPSSVTIMAASTADQTRVGVAQVTVISPQPSASDFHMVGCVTVPCSGATAILLPDGRVLISGCGLTPELYNPATATFQASSAIMTGTPVLLHNGELFFVSPAGMAELYDPKTDSTTSIGQLLVVNQSIFAATVLANGKALVLGTHDAEVYDPASGNFSFTGPYAAMLGNVITTAVGLADGRVLILGSDPPQLFDPVANSFSLTGSLSGTELNGADLYSATLLQDGRVLVAGGMSYGRTNAAVVYDPAIGKFTATGSMNDARDDHAAVLLKDGRVLVLGGDGWACSGLYCYYTGSLSSAELYDPTTGSFSPVGSMNQARTGPTATLLQNGDVLITGGVIYCGIGCFLGPTSSAEIYHPE
jgi:hypothetical protein